MLSLRRPFLHYSPPLHSKTLTLTPSSSLKFDPKPQSHHQHINNNKHCLDAVVVPRRWPNIIAAVIRSPKVEEQKFSQEGSVTESLRDGMFRVQLDNGDNIIGYISGKIRKNFIKILPGDRVKVEVTRYDTSRGRIVTRIDTQKKDPNKKSQKKGLKKGK